MLFVDRWQLGVFLLLTILTVLPITAFRLTRQKRLFIRVPIQILGVPVLGLAALCLLLLLVGQISGSKTYGQPVYSPDHKFAARVETYDVGATGGGTSVVLYGSRGLWSKRAFRGGFKSVKDKDLVWSGTADLSIGYDRWDGYDEECTSPKLRDVVIHCMAHSGK